MGLDPNPFDRIKSGKKLIEARLTVDKYKQPRTLKVGDIICFECNDDRSHTLQVEVVALLYYPTFAALVDDFDPKRYFGRDSKEELLTNLRRRYSEADEQRYGVLGIKVRVLDT
jgi:ASC-1-like (ASCH) protein